MSFFDFPQWRTPRGTSGRRRRRVAETLTVLTSEIERLELRELLGGLPVINANSVILPAEGNPGPFTQVQIIVMLSATSATDVTMNFATQDGTANSNGSVNNGFQSDYVSRTGVLTIPAGQSSGTIQFQVVGDNLVEPGESFQIVLSNPSGAMFDGATSKTVSIVISDDENPNDPAVSVSNPTIVEGNSGTKNVQVIVSVFPTPTSQNPITYFFFTPDDTATDPGDYQSQDGSGTIAAGQIADTLNIPIVGDRSSEPTESFLVVIEAVSNANVSIPVGRVTIQDNDGGGGGNNTRITISSQDTATTEGDSGTTAMTFPLTLSETSSVPMTINVTYKDRSATTSEDYSDAVRQKVIPAGALADTLVVPVLGDMTHEPSESFSVKLSAPAGSDVVFNSKKFFGTINDNDPVPNIVVQAAVMVNENADAAQFIVSLSNPTSDRLSFNVEFVPGTANSPDDFKSKRQKIKFVPGQFLDTIAIPIVNDNTVEPTETFNYTITNVMNGTILGTGSGGVITIVDDD